MVRRSEKRGFASMDPERRRRIASEGGRSSRGGRGRDYEDDYDDDYENDYDEDEDQGVSGRYGNEDYDDYEDEYDEDDDRGVSGRHRDEDEYDDEDDEYDEEDEDTRGSRRGLRKSTFGGRGRSSGRGFAGINPEQRRIARRGGEATARTHGRGFYEEIGRRRGGESGSDEYGPEFYSRIGRRGGGARWEEDDDYRGNPRGRSSSGGRRYSSGGRSTHSDYSSSGRRGSSGGRRSSNSGRRGFGAMPREEVRRIARMGGRARWEGSHRGGSRGGSSRSR